MASEDSGPAAFPSAREAVRRSILCSLAQVAAAAWGTQTCINAHSHAGSVTEAEDVGGLPDEAALPECQNLLFA